MNLITRFLPFLLCLYAIPLSARAEQSRDTARYMLSELATKLSGSSGANLIMDKTSLDIDLDCRLEADTLHLSYYYKSDDAKPISQPLIKLFYASMRSDTEIAGGEVMARLLREAECVLMFHYHYPGNPDVTLTLTPDEIIRLKTEPFDNLGLDREAITNELLECFNEGFKEDTDDDSILHSAATLHGLFITLSYKYSTSQEFLAQENTPETTQAIIHTIINELGPGAKYILTQTSQAGSFLGLKGLKLDYSDVSGRQKVYVYTWADITNALESFQAETYPYELAEIALNAIDEQMSINFAEEDMPWTQTHCLNEKSLIVFIDCKQTETEFEEYLPMFTRDTMLELYAEALKIALKDIPDITSVTIMAAIGELPMTTVTLSREEIFNHVPVDDNGAPFVDDNGHIHT